MKSRTAPLALVIGLALAPGARAADTLDAVLLGSNEVPGPGSTLLMASAAVAIQGTTVSLTISGPGTQGWMDVHIHKGAAGVAGKVVAELAERPGPAVSPRTFSGSVSPARAADLVANPESYYVHVHTAEFPAGAGRGQLAARTAPDAAPAAAASPLPPGGPTPPAPGVVLPAPDLPAELPSDEAPRPTPVREPDQLIRFRPIPDLIWGDPDFTLEASATSGLPVAFDGSGDCTVRGSTVHLLSAGKCFLTARQAGDARFNPAPEVEQRIPIEKASQRIRGAAPRAKTWLDPDFPLDVRATSGLPVQFIAQGDCAVDGSTVHILGAGSCFLTAHQPGDANFTAAPIVDLEFEIARADQKIFLSRFPDPLYGAQDLPLTARASSELPVRFTAWGSCWIAEAVLHGAPGTCTVTAEQPGNANFNPAPPVTQTFTIQGPG